MLDKAYHEDNARRKQSSTHEDKQDMKSLDGPSQTDINSQLKLGQFESPT